MSNQPWLLDLIEDKLLPILAQLTECEADITKVQQLNHWLRLRWMERGFKLSTTQQHLMAQTRAAIIQRFGDTHFSLRYIDFTESESTLLVRATNSDSQIESSFTSYQSCSEYTEHTTKKPKKHSSSFAFWSEDRHDLTFVLEQFPGSNQRDRVKAWIAWSRSQLQHNSHDFTN